MNYLFKFFLVTGITPLLYLVLAAVDPIQDVSLLRPQQRTPITQSRRPITTNANGPMNRISLYCSLLAALFAGCASSYSPFTQDVRTSSNVDACVFHVGTEIVLRSVRLLEPLQEGPFKNDGRRYYTIRTEDSGKAVAQGEDWIAVDFGRGIVLQFQRNAADGKYGMPGWGTITIAEDRYDIEVGVLSGRTVYLFWEPVKTE